MGWERAEKCSVNVKAQLKFRKTSAVLHGIRVDYCTIHARPPVPLPNIHKFRIPVRPSFSVRKGNTVPFLFDIRRCAAAAVPYLKKDFMTVRSSRISANSLQSSQEEIIPNSFTGLKFRVDKFMFLNSDPNHIWLFGCNLCGPFDRTEKLINF